MRGTWGDEAVGKAGLCDKKPRFVRIEADFN
jgi:hypothetical protein